MGFDKRDGGIDEYAVQLIRYKSGQLAGQAGFRVSDRDDLEQELVFDLWRRLPRYDPARARRNTFIARVVEHKIASLIEAQKAAMRDYRRCRWSLNDRIEDSDGRSLEREETIDQDDYMLRIGARSRPAEELHDLAIDVASLLETLPPELRELCRRLEAETVSETSRATGVPRGTLYESIRKLRKICEEAGLKEYLG